MSNEPAWMIGGQRRSTAAFQAGALARTEDKSKAPPAELSYRLRQRWEAGWIQMDSVMREEAEQAQLPMTPRELLERAEVDPCTRALFSAILDRLWL